MWGSAGFLIGIVLGSLVKALADRSLSNKSFWGRSYCLRCRHTLAVYDLFPVLSYVLLRGKCRYCKDRISIEYLVVEVVMGMLIGFLFWQEFSSLQSSAFSLQLISNFKFLIFIFDLLFKTFFIVILAILFITDIKRMLIPDRIIKPAILIGTISLLVITAYKVGYLYYYLAQTPIGRQLLPPSSGYFQRHALMVVQPFLLSLLMGLLIGGFFWGLIIITRGKGMGGGDVKLGAFIGVMLGFPQALLALVLAFFTGAIFGVALIIAGKKHFGQTIPFGPFLVLGSLITIFWGNQIIGWYLRLRVFIP
ncbi:MAG: prepilin peptidase [Candidatus Daviesbacteria bacterium]|nr:prepilin peptidase [Candidatus Daviesbacteria bacterium]